MIMHVKSKRHHARNRRKLKSCLWVDVKVTLITKLISKNVFNFCSRRKKDTEPGLASYLVIVIFPLDCCSWYCRAQAVVRGRALHDADTARHERGAALLTLPRAAAGHCPALHWALHQSPVSCPEQLAQSSVCQAELEQDSGNAPQINFATKDGPLVLP